MRSTERGAGLALAVGATLTSAGFATHPIGEGVTFPRTIGLVIRWPTLWRASHALIAFGVMALAVGGLVLLATRSSLADGPLAAVGWGLVVVASVPFVVALLLQASVVVDLTLTGDLGALRTWYEGFVLALLAGSWPLFLGFAFVSAEQFRSDTPIVPRWASAVATAGFLVTIVYFVGLAFRIPELSLAQYAAAPGILWLLAVGVRLFRLG